MPTTFSWKTFQTWLDICLFAELKLQVSLLFRGKHILIFDWAKSEQEISYSKYVMQALSSNRFATTRKGVVLPMLEWEFHLLENEYNNITLGISNNTRAPSTDYEFRP